MEFFEESQKRRESSLFARFWTLCLLDGLSRNGLGPNMRNEIFSFAYLACAVASEFKISSIQHAVLKNEAGPKLLIVSRALDRLIAGGFVDVCDMPKSVVHIGSHIEGHYLISNRGQEILKKSTVSSEYLRPIFQFLQDATYAFGSLSPEEISFATRFDASFCDMAVADGDVVDLGEWEPGNRTTDIINFLRNYSRQIYSNDPMVACEMYAQFLEGKVHATSNATIFEETLS